MCLFAIMHRVVPDCPVLVFANREEAYDRPSIPPRLVDCTGPKAAWFGGGDLVAGGTWLGVNEFGLVVAVTNRPKSSVPEEPRSRGLLCRDLLECRSLEAAVERSVHELDTGAFAGCNIALADREAAVVIEAVDEFRTVRLTAGIHVMTNGSIDDLQDPRILRTSEELQKLSRQNTLDEWIAEGRRICGLHKERDQPAICRHGTEGGTVSSAIIAVTADVNLARYLYAPGSPCRTAYEDYSSQMVQLLQRPGCGFPT